MRSLQVIRGQLKEFRILPSGVLRNAYSAIPHKKVICDKYRTNCTVTVTQGPWIVYIDSFSAKLAQTLLEGSSYQLIAQPLDFTNNNAPRMLLLLGLLMQLV